MRGQGMWAESGNSFALQYMLPWGCEQRAERARPGAPSRKAKHYTWNRVLLFSVFKLITSEFMLRNGENARHQQRAKEKLKLFL